MTDKLEKLARTRRKEPAQEAIVEDKDRLNQRMSNLIHLLIELKKGWNGRPAPEVGVTEKINLTQPLPPSIPQYGQTALHELEQIIQELNQVANEQGNYSTGKMRAREERMQAMQKLQEQSQAQEQPAATPEPTQEQRQAAFDDMLLVKVASNKLTRLWAHVVAPFSSEKGRGERLEMLRGLARVDSNLRDLEEAILKGDPGILEAVEIAKQLYIDARVSFFDSLRKNLYEMNQSAEKQLADIKSEMKEAKIKAELKTKPTEPLEGGPVTAPDSKKPTKTTPASKPDDDAAFQKVQKRIDDLEGKIQQAINKETKPAETPAVPPAVAPEVAPPAKATEVNKPTAPAPVPEEPLHDGTVQVPDNSLEAPPVSPPPPEPAAVQEPAAPAAPEPVAVKPETVRPEPKPADKGPITPHDDLESWWGGYLLVHNSIKNNAELVKKLKSLDTKKAEQELRKHVNDGMENLGFVGPYKRDKSRKIYLNVAKAMRTAKGLPVDITEEAPAVVAPVEAPVQEVQPLEVVQEEAAQEAETASQPAPGITLQDYTKFVMDNVSGWWKKFFQPIMSVKNRPNAPSQWLDILDPKVFELQVHVEHMNELETKYDLEVSYLEFLYIIGEIQAILNAFTVEEQAKNTNPNFEYGSLLDPVRIEGQAKTFVQLHRKDLNAVGSMYETSLASYGSRLSRFVKRMLQNVSGGKDRGVRLKADQEVRSSRKNLQTIMDNLEKRNINFRSLISSSSGFLESMGNLYDRLADLADMYNARIKIEKAKHKMQKSRMPYDVITSIESLRRIGNTFRKDISITQSLEIYEKELAEISDQLDALNEGENE